MFKKKKALPYCKETPLTFLGEGMHEPLIIFKLTEKSNSLQALKTLIFKNPLR